MKTQYKILIGTAIICAGYLPLYFFHDIFKKKDYIDKDYVHQVVHERDSIANYSLSLMRDKIEMMKRLNSEAIRWQRLSNVSDSLETALSITKSKPSTAHNNSSVDSMRNYMLTPVEL